MREEFQAVAAAGLLLERRDEKKKSHEFTPLAEIRGEVELNTWAQVGAADPEGIFLRSAGDSALDAPEIPENSSGLGWDQRLQGRGFHRSPRQIPGFGDQRFLMGTNLTAWVSS